jgi:hypothetical protein
MGGWLMSSAVPYILPVASTIPFSSDRNGLAITSNVQDAIDKLSWFFSIQDHFDEYGNFVIKLKSKILDSIYLSSEDNNVHQITITNSGELASELVTNFIGQTDNFKIFKKPSDNHSSISLNKNGELVVYNIDDPRSFSQTQVDKKIMLNSSNKVNWVVGINNNDEIVTSPLADGGGGFFKILDKDDNTVFSINSNLNGLNYLSSYTRANLPNPSILSNANIPWIFLEENNSKIPIFFDGYVWRYFSNNQSI